MKIWRPVLLVLLALALIFTAFMLEMDYVVMLGFPDNSTTAFDRAESNAVWAFDRFTVVVALWLVGLAFWRRNKRLKLALAWTVALYAGVVVILVAADYYFAATLPGPPGG